MIKIRINKNTIITIKNPHFYGNSSSNVWISSEDENTIVNVEDVQEIESNDEIIYKRTSPEPIPRKSRRGQILEDSEIPSNWMELV